MSVSVSALILIDWQVGFDDHAAWGGARCNLDAEANALALLAAWRKRGDPVVHVVHDSLEPASLLRRDAPSGALKPGFEPAPSEPLLVKRVNSCFIGTDLDGTLRRMSADHVTVMGLTTDHCVSTTVRMAGNLGYRVDLIGDACATFDRIGPDGAHWPAAKIQAIHLASLHGEFCTVRGVREVAE